MLKQLRLLIQVIVPSHYNQLHDYKISLATILEEGGPDFLTHNAVVSSNVTSSASLQVGLGHQLTVDKVQENIICHVPRSSSSCRSRGLCSRLLPLCLVSVVLVRHLLRGQGARGIPFSIARWMHTDVSQPLVQPRRADDILSDVSIAPTIDCCERLRTYLRAQDIVQLSCPNE